MLPLPIKTQLLGENALYGRREKVTRFRLGRLEVIRDNLVDRWQLRSPGEETRLNYSTS
jgi:hypothetical protein